MWSESIKVDPTAAITIGSPIYTRDYQKIGTVADMGAKGIRVKTTFLQREYWLASDTVRSVASDGAVMLEINKSEIGAHKVA